MVSTLGEQNMEDFFLGSFKSLILATWIDVDISMLLIALKAYKKKLACRSSHGQLPSMVQIRVCMPSIFQAYLYIQPLVV